MEDALLTQFHACKQFTVSETVQARSGELMSLEKPGNVSTLNAFADRGSASFSESAIKLGWTS